MLRQTNRLAVLMLAAVAAIVFTACSPVSAASENTPSAGGTTSPLAAAPAQTPITGTNSVAPSGAPTVAATSAAPSSAPSEAPTAAATSAASGSAPTAASNSSPSASSTVTSTTPGTSASSAVFPLKTATTTTLGPILVDGNGMTLYGNKNDTATSSTCTDTCAQAWPPLIVSNGQNASLDQTLSGQLGTVKRADGSTQVTYNGMPLYYYGGDHNPGDTTGQGKGGMWSVIVVGGSSGSATPVSPGAGTTTTPYSAP